MLFGAVVLFGRVKQHVGLPAHVFEMCCLKTSCLALPLFSPVTKEGVYSLPFQKKTKERIDEKFFQSHW